MRTKYFYVLLALSGVMSVTNAHGWGRKWKPLHGAMCPSQDPDTHECFELKIENSTCLVMYISGCYPDIPDVCFLQFATKQVPCPVYTCSHRGCCSGYDLDENRQCVKAGYPSDLQKRCENGGMPEGNKCMCLPMFTGSTCEEPICQKPCLNGGRCEMVAGRPVCVCSSSRFSGEQCENVECLETCLNGGSCRLDGVQARCDCPAGYQGFRCQYNVNYHCPVIDRTEMSKECKDESGDCHRDAECSGNAICCFDGCKGVCRKPEKMSCSANGHLYKPGEMFSPSACERCVCQAWGVLKCTTMQCPPIQCPDGHTSIRVQGHCCKICPGTNVLDGEAPRFTNCPSRFIAVDITEEGGPVSLCSIGLNAVDMYGMELEVTYSDKQLFHSHSSDVRKNVHIVMAFSSSDQFGRRAECQFQVIVRDPFPPKFTSCPTEIYALNSERVTWQDPEVTDNVGIYRLVIDGDVIRNTLLPVGAYPVSITAWDYDKNQAICAFIVRVFDENMSETSMPSELRARKEGPMSIGIILGSSIGFVVALSVCICLAVRIRQQRSHRDTPTTEHRRPDFINSIYAICAPRVGTHTYVNDVKFPNLPDYAPPLNPPSYDEINNCDELGVTSYEEEPPIYEEIDNKPTSEHTYQNTHQGHTNQAFSITEPKFGY
ncbi:sushi, von Willebrand factor type A, EGF and pentraxin domain-containing protein 1-like [Dreissena polymorpha]|nr:sushi, von Willebrand factor type A, EGF and pentraxin domain-containing protein 1-like [Dreissena polymorpha]